MYKTKRELDEHVAKLFSPIRSERDKIPKYLHIAGEYMKLREYRTAKTYIERFVESNPQHFEAHRLLGDSCFALKDYNAAFKAYTRAHSINTRQPDVIMKVCDVCCRMNLDAETKRHWLETAEKICPNEAAVLRLKESLLKSEANNIPEMENVIQQQIGGDPSNASLRCKLVELYVSRDRIDDAIKEIRTVETGRHAHFSFRWYRLAAKVLLDEYKKGSRDQAFTTLLLCVLNRLATLSFSESHFITADEFSSTDPDSSDEIEPLKCLDQTLLSAHNAPWFHDGAWTFVLAHMDSQLYYHIACSLLKRAKMEKDNTQEDERRAAALLALAHSVPPPYQLQQESWFKKLTDNTLHVRLYHEACYRVSISGHLLRTLAGDEVNKYIDSAKNSFLNVQGRERIHERVVGAEANLSWFLKDNRFINPTLTYPTTSALLPYDRAASTLYPSSLEHLVWLSLHGVQPPINKIFDGLEFSCSLSESNVVVHSFCLLDAEAFLCATVTCVKAFAESRSSQLPLGVPPEMSKPFCTSKQVTWWKAACMLFVRQQNTSRCSDYRTILRNGLEVIRCCATDGGSAVASRAAPSMPLLVIAALAQYFNDWAHRGGVKPADKQALLDRSVHYWFAVLRHLDRGLGGSVVKSGSRFITATGSISTKEPLFDLPPTYAQARTNEDQLYEDAIVAIGKYHLELENYDAAALRLADAKSPQGMFYFARACKQLARKCAEELMDGSIVDSPFQENSKFRNMLNSSSQLNSSSVGNISLALDSPNRAETQYRLLLERARAALQQALLRSQSLNLEMTQRIGGELDAVESMMERGLSADTTLDRTGILNSSNTQRMSRQQFASPLKRNDLSLLNTSLLTPAVNTEKLESQVENVLKAQDEIKSLLSEFRRDFTNEIKAVKTQLTNFSTEQQNIKSMCDDIVMRMALRDEEVGYGGEEENYSYSHHPQQQHASLSAAVAAASHRMAAAGGSVQSAMDLQALLSAPPSGAIYPPGYLQNGALYPPHHLLPPPSANAAGLSFSPGQSLPQLNLSSLQLPPGVLASSLAPPGSAPPVLGQPPPASMMLPPGGAPHQFQIPVSPLKLPPAAAAAVSSSTTQLSGPGTTTSVTATSWKPTEELLFESAASLYYCTAAGKWAPKCSGEARIIRDRVTNIVHFTMCDDLGVIAVKHNLGSHIKYKVVPNAQPDVAWTAQNMAEIGPDGTVAPRMEKYYIKILAPNMAEEFQKVFVDACAPAATVAATLATTVVSGFATSSTTTTSQVPPPSITQGASSRTSAEVAKPIAEFAPKFTAVSSSSTGPTPVSASAISKAFGITQPVSSSSAFMFCSSTVTNAATTKPAAETKPSIFAPVSTAASAGGIFGLGVASSFTTDTTSAPKQTFGGFTFSSTPQVAPLVTPSKEDAAKLKEDKKPDSAPKPFANFSFGSFSGMQTSTPTKSAVATSQSAASPVKAASPLKEANKEEATGDEEYEPAVDFKPVIPLPDLVDAKTGEEEEETLFCERSKLYRFDREKKEWKERGLGDLKVLKNPKTNKARIVMRREQVLKLCANHYITPDIEVKPGKKDTLVSWFAQDFSDGEVSTEGLQARFKTKEIADTFIAIVNGLAKGSATVVSVDLKKEPETKQDKPVSLDKFKQKAGSWNCDVCMVNNAADVTRCPACETPKPGSAPKSSSASKQDEPVSLDKFKQRAGTWNCDVCMVNNAADVTRCPACETPKPGSAPKSSSASKQDEPVSLDKFKQRAGTWNCDVCMVNNAADVTTCAACETPKPGSAPKPSSASVLSKLGAGPASGGEGFGGFPVATTGSPSQFKFGFTPATDASTKGNEQSSGTTASSSIFGGTAPATTAVSASLFEQKPPVNTTPFATTGFTFGAATTTPASSKGGSIFGTAGSSAFSFSSTPATSSIFGTTPETTTASGSGLVFGTPKSTSAIGGATFSFGPPSTTAATGGFAFGTTSNTPVKTTGFTFGTPQKHEFSFQLNSTQATSPGASGAAAADKPETAPEAAPETPSRSAAGNDNDDDSNCAVPESPDIYFPPVIPLPPKVDVCTGEENEQVEYTHRGKLFRFVNGEWKERGLGDIKILYNSETGKMRLTMRRDQVLKVCLNHYITADIEFTTKDSKSIQWSAVDFSDETPASYLFALRMKSPEVASEFLEAVQAAQKKLKEAGTPTASPAKAEAAPAKSETTPVKPIEKTPEKLKTVAPIQTTPVAPPKANLPTTPANFSFKLEDHAVTTTTTAAVASTTTTTLQGTSLFGKFSLADKFGVSTTPTAGTGSIFGGSVASGEKSSDRVFGFGATPGTTTSSIFGAGTFSFSQGAASNIATQSVPPQHVTTDDDELVFVKESHVSEDLVKKARELMLPDDFYSYLDRKPCKGCAGCNDEIDKLSTSPRKKKDGKKASSSDSGVTKKAESSSAAAAAGVTSTTTTAMPIFKATGFSFENALSQIPEQGFTGGFKATTAPQQLFKDAGKKLFDENREATEGDDDAVAPSADIHFEPVIPLPDLISVRTGEEDDEVLFSSRARLYLYARATNEWKERATGELKILRNAQTNRRRIIMRREQVHKVACNHYITPDMTIQPLNTSTTSLSWTALDYSEGEGVASTFAVKIKAEDVRENFKRIFIESTQCEVTMPSSPARQEQQEASGSAQQQQYDEEEYDEQENYEDDPHRDDYGEYEDDGDCLMFERSCTLHIEEPCGSNKFVTKGRSIIRIQYDDSVYGAIIRVWGEDRATGGNGELFAETVIAVQNCLKVKGTDCLWTATDISGEEPVRRRFKVTFADPSDAQEFNDVFQEGKTYAVESVIVETDDHHPPQERSSNA